MGITKRLISILVAFAAVPTIFVGALGYVYARTAIESVRAEGLNSIADFKAKKIKDLLVRQKAAEPGSRAREQIHSQILELVRDFSGLGDSGETLVAQKKKGHIWFIHPVRHDPARYANRPVDAGNMKCQPVKNALAGENGSGRAVDYRNKPVLAAWRQMNGGTWALVVKIDLAEVYAPTIFLKISVMILILVTLTMGILVTIAVSRTITTPILSLKDGVEIIGRGNLDFQINIKSKNEIGKLAASFNQMAKNLRTITASRDQLNQEVEKRILTQQSLQARTHDLRNRINELNCLFNLSKLLEQKDLSTQDVFRSFVDLIPSAFQHLENPCARIEFAATGFSTLNFSNNCRHITADIMVYGRPQGRVIAGCLERAEEKGRTACFEQETALIEAIAQRLGKFMERRQAEQALAASEKRFRDLVENSLTGISIVQNQEVVYQNKEQERLLGPLPRKYLLGDIKTIHPDDVARVRRFAAMLESGGVLATDMDFRCFPKDMARGEGDMKWLQCRASLTEYKGEKAILMNIMDITQAKRMEHMLRIQDKMASLGRVAAGIAHEIRNPLSGINIYINTLEKLLLRGNDPKKAQEILGHIQSASGKIESVIRRVIDFSKPTEPKFAMININQAVNDAVNLSGVTLRKRGIVLEKTLAKNLPGSLADPQMIEEVILNLINNATDAMRHMEGEKKISIATSVENDHIIIAVADSGPGVGPRARDRIFDPFYTTKPDSTGIGLSICHRIIRDHDGVIQVHTGKWGGAEFLIRLPVKGHGMGRA